MKKILPYDEPAYSAYNYMGALNVCGQKDRRMEEWIMEKCVLWKYNINENRLTIMNSSVLSEIPFMHQHYMWKKHIKENYRDIFKALLDDGFYISYDNVDEYYIPSTGAYKNKHFWHDGLIYGYDDEKGKYYISTYNAKRKYTNFDVPMDLFDKAWHSKYNNSMQEGEGTIIALRLDTTTEYKADANKIIENIKKYVDSVVVGIKQESTVFGFDVYKAIKKRIELAICDQIKADDIRLFKVFSEHKLMMKKRIEYLFKEAVLPLSFVNDYNNLFELTEKTRMIYLKYTFTKNKELLFAIKDNINKIANEEFRLLNKIH